MCYMCVRDPGIKLQNDTETRKRLSRSQCTACLPLCTRVGDAVYEILQDNIKRKKMKIFQITEGQCRKIVQHYETQSQLWTPSSSPAAPGHMGVLSCHISLTFAGFGWQRRLCKASGCRLALTGLGCHSGFTQLLLGCKPGCLTCSLISL